MAFQLGILSELPIGNVATEPYLLNPLSIPKLQVMQLSPAKTKNYLFAKRFTAFVGTVVGISSAIIDYHRYPSKHLHYMRGGPGKAP